jgi:hypothetical protein
MYICTVLLYLKLFKNDKVLFVDVSPLLTNWQYTPAHLSDWHGTQVAERGHGLHISSMACEYIEEVVVDS